jgi:hypothetical protein
VITIAVYTYYEHYLINTNAVKQIEEERAQREAEEKEAEEKLHSMNVVVSFDIK